MVVNGVVVYELTGVVVAVVVVGCRLGLTVKFMHQPVSIAPLLPVEFENTYNCQVPVAPAPLKACPMVLGPAGSPLPIGLGKGNRFAEREA